MNYKILVVYWYYLVFSCTSLTDISLLKCPSSFSITNSNKSSSSIYNSWGKNIYTGFNSSSSHVQNIILSQNPQMMQQYVIQLMVPYIITSIVFIGIFIMLILWCIFDQTCPPIQCCHRNIIHNPYTNKQLNCTIGIVLFCTVGILVCCVLALSSIPQLKKSLEQVSCSLYMGLDISLNGDNNWGGFIKIRNLLGNISSSLSSTTTQISTYFTGDDFLLNDMFKMQKNNQDIYRHFSKATLNTPNPSSDNKINSLFIEIGLGPNNKSNTMVNDIQTILNHTSILSNQAALIQSSALMIDSSIEIIKKNLIQSQNKLLFYIAQLTDSNKELDNFNDKYLDQYFTQMLYLLQGVLGFILCGSLLIGVSSIATHFLKIVQCRFMIHIAWILLIFTFFGLIVLLFIVLSLGSIGYSFCIYYSNVLVSEVEFNKIRFHDSQHVFNNIDVCLYGDNNILNSFQSAQQVQTINEIFQNMALFYKYDNKSNVDYINRTQSIQKLQKWKDILQNYKLGIYIDTYDYITNDDNPNQAIKSLNLYTNTGGGVPTCTKDRWVYDVINCTNSSEDIYSVHNGSKGQDISNSTIICISFNQAYSNISQKWNQTDFIKRYIQIRNQCPQAYSKILQYGSRIISYRDSRYDMFLAIQEKVSQIIVQHINFNSLIDNYRSRVDQFDIAVEKLKDTVTNQVSGLIVLKNCAILGDFVWLTYNLFCGNFMVEIYKLVVLIIVLLFLVLIDIFSGSYLAVQCASVQKQKMLQPPQEISTITENIFLRDQQVKNSDSD